MKFISILLLCLLNCGLIKGQAAISMTKNHTDSIVLAALDKNSQLSGAYEISYNNSCAILYFTIQSKFEASSESFMYRESVTVFNILYSTDNTNFTKYVIDTIAQSPGSCWAPKVVDSLLYINVDKDTAKEICVVLKHVPYCDLYFSYASVLFFDDIFANNITGSLPKFTRLPDFSFDFFELPLSPKSKYQDIITSKLRVKGLIE